MSRPRHTPLVGVHDEPGVCGVDHRLHVLGQTPFFTGMTPPELSEINTRFRATSHVAGETIYWAGKPTTHLYVVATGRVKILRHSESGQDVILDILTPGDFFGSLPTLGYTEYPETAETLTTSCILGITADAFQTILQEYPPVALKVLNMVSQRLLETQEMVRQLSAHPVGQRVAATLLRLAEKVGEEQPDRILLQVPLSRQDLAAMTGATTETVSRTLSQMQHDEIIETGRRWVAIRDRDRLIELAGDALE